MRFVLRVTLWVGVTAVVAMSGCIVLRPGDNCHVSESDCSDRDTLLDCEGGVFVAIPCSGPQGCYHVSGSPVCDSSNAVEGDRCASSQDGAFTCSPDNIDEEQCQSGFWTTIDTCANPTFCVSDAGNVSCH